MNLYELYDFVNKKMEKDGKSFRRLEKILEASDCYDDEKAGIIRDVIDPKYLPMGFDGKVDPCKGGWMLMCLNWDNGEVIYRHLFEYKTLAVCEMKKQYWAFGHVLGEGELYPTRAYVSIDGVNLEWSVFNIEHHYNSGELAENLKWVLKSKSEGES